MSVTAVNPRFHPGQLMITRNANDTLPHVEVDAAIKRHLSGDWGDVCPSDGRLNEDALKHGDRLFSVYHTQDGEKAVDQPRAADQPDLADGQGQRRTLHPAVPLAAGHHLLEAVGTDQLPFQLLPVELLPPEGLDLQRFGFLIESLDALALGGLLVYIIPYYRLTPDICRVLVRSVVWIYSTPFFRSTSFFT